MKPRPRFTAILGNTLFMWATIAIASVLLWPTYQGPSLIILIVVTTVVASLIAIVGALARLSSAVLFIITFATFLVIGVPLAVPQEATSGVLPSVEGLRQLIAGVALGWKQLLTITLPVGNYQALLVPPFVLLLVVVVTGLSIALRSKLGDLAVLAPIILFVSAIIFGPEQPTWPIPVTLALAFTCLVWLMWRRWYARRRAIDALRSDALAAGADEQPIAASARRVVSLRAVIGGVLILAIAGGIAAGAATYFPPDGRRQVLRSAVEQPFDPRDYVSPLASFRRYLGDGLATSVLFTVSGLPDESRIRIATLDSYDGVVFAVGSDQVDSASGSFTRVPFRFDQSDVNGDRVSVNVEIEAYTGVWMPTVGQLESVDFAGSRTTTLRDSFYYNNVGGTAAIVGGLRSGDGYTLNAVVPRQPSEATIPTLQPGSATVPQIGVLPAEVEVALSDYVDGIEGSGAQLAAMLEAIRQNGYISHGIDEDEPASRSGHSADRITELLTEQRMIGDAEQYAVTAALMARQLGFPARVVFGFAPDAAEGATTEVTGEDVSAWIEVNTQEFGWVTIDPTPEEREIPEELPEDPTVVARPQPIIPPQATDPVDRPPVTPLDPEQDESDLGNEWLAVLLTVLIVAGWIVLGAGILLAPFLIIVFAKWRRRRLRNRAGNPVDRIRGGWQEFADAVVDNGFEPPKSATRREVASVVGGGRATVLAAVTDRAVFSPAHMQPEDADKVWRAVNELTANLSVGRTRWERIKARISLKSLGGYGFRSLFRRRGDLI